MKVKDIDEVSEIISFILITDSEKNWYKVFKGHSGERPRSVDEVRVIEITVSRNQIANRPEHDIDNGGIYVGQLLNREWYPFDEFKEEFGECDIRNTLE